MFNDIQIPHTLVSPICQYNFFLSDEVPSCSNLIYFPTVCVCVCHGRNAQEMILPVHAWAMELRSCPNCFFLFNLLWGRWAIILFRRAVQGSILKEETGPPSEYKVASHRNLTIITCIICCYEPMGIPGKRHTSSWDLTIGNSTFSKLIYLFLKNGTVSAVESFWGASSLQKEIWSRISKSRKVGVRDRGGGRWDWDGLRNHLHPHVLTH